MSEQELHILQHSLGCDEFGESATRHKDEGDGCFEYYRNRYVSDPTDVLTAMVGKRLLENLGPVAMYGGMNFYRVTAFGVGSMKQHSKKLTPSKRRYRDYLNADSGMSFGEWLKRRGRCDGRESGCESARADQALAPH